MKDCTQGSQGNLKLDPLEFDVYELGLIYEALIFHTNRLCYDHRIYDENKKAKLEDIKDICDRIEKYLTGLEKNNWRN